MTDVSSSPHLFRRQISLHERGRDSDVSSKIRKSESIHRLRRNFEYGRFLSVEQRSISDTEDNAINTPSIQEDCPFKTKSCANLELSCLHVNSSATSTPPRSPGSVLVKEKFIELPKHYAKSIHGSSTSVSTSQRDSRENISVTMNVTETAKKFAKARFTTTRVDEAQCE